MDGLWSLRNPTPKVSRFKYWPAWLITSCVTLCYSIFLSHNFLISKMEEIIVHSLRGYSKDQIRYLTLHISYLGKLNDQYAIVLLKTKIYIPHPKSYAMCFTLKVNKYFLYLRNKLEFTKVKKSPKVKKIYMVALNSSYPPNWSLLILFFYNPITVLKPNPSVANLSSGNSRPNRPWMKPNLLT